MTGMEPNGKTNWTVYLLLCADSSIYCGVCLTENLQKRIGQHNSGKGAKYTSGRIPVQLLDHRGGLTKKTAYRLEYRVKKQKKARKQIFLQAFVP